MKRLLTSAALAASVFSVSAAQAAEPITFAHVSGWTGPLEAYVKQVQIGLEMGFEYATKGTNEILGRKINLITKDDQTKPDLARALVAEAYTKDDAIIVFGAAASGVAIATLPVAEEHQRIIIPVGVADSITGSDWNRYVFRIGRNSSQDAISNAIAVAKPGACIATIAQDYAFGRDGVAAYKKAAESKGAKVVHEEYAPVDATDFTAPAQRLFDSLKDRSDCKTKYIFSIWAGSNSPMPKIQDMDPGRYGIVQSTGGNILPVLAAYKQFPGLEGAGYYYYENPNNEVNDWFVREHMKRYNSPPDFFTAQGMATAMAVVAGIEKAGSTDVEDIIEAMEGLTFDSPKGKMTIRPEDHQTLQPMYHFKIRVDDSKPWAIPELVREIPASEMDIPILNK